MDPQWQAYADATSGRPGQFNNGLGGGHAHQLTQKYPAVNPGNGTQSQQHQAQAPTGYTYESYQTPGTAPKAPSGNLTTSKTVSMTSSPAPLVTDDFRDTDVTMEDADPYNRTKYPTRPTHHHHSSLQLLSSEESSAARRYSPMNVITPSVPYNSSPNTSQNPYTYHPAGSSNNRPSPTRASTFSSPPQNYQSQSSGTSRQQSRLPAVQPAEMSSEQYYPQSATSQLGAAFSQDLNLHRGQSQQHMSQQQQQQHKRGPVPRFVKIKSTQELKPRINAQPAFRRANPEGGFISPLQALTTHLPSSYRICNPSFKYESSRNPRRVLTKPSKGVKNDGYDNDDSDYILYVNDILGSEEANHKNRYLILDVLGQGTFGQVVKCQNLKTQEVVAVKVVKNRTAYFNQSMMEVSVLDLINSKLDKNDDHHLLRLRDTFIHRQHLCLVFELLSVNLYELIKQNQFRGLSTTLVRVFTQQLLNGLSLLNKARLIHCDLKPENILLKNLESPIIKIIDFGSACDERQTVYTYIQSRFYRSPEVLLGLPYSSAIDMWSLGCIVVELFLGLPLFPGSSEYNQVSRITEMLGMPPNWMLEMGKQAGEFFEKTQDEFGRRSYRLKSMEQYSREHNTKEQPSKKYFQATTLPEIIRSYSMPRKNMKQAEIDREMNNRVAFIDFVRGLLNINPLERWSPQQAKLHPFITQQKYTQPFVPPMNLKSSALNKTVAPGVQQQQQAEAASKQRAAQAQAQAQSAAQAQSYALQMNNHFQQPTHGQPATVYNSMYTPHQQGAPPPYPSQPSAYSHQMPIMQQASHIPQQQFNASQSLYAQATTRAGRQRASTMDQQQGGIPPSIQRVASHLDPNAPIRLQPSPAYYPPPADGYVGDSSAAAAVAGRRRGSRTTASGAHGRSNRDFIRTLEDGAMGDGFMGQNQWH
ncbi:serine/threonine-protein kinase ppk15 [Paracoccidioides lutzii Pb01]|uniref:Serine/threonine-protein kinase ppk15 n=1 Tax=Paracoccidioides lutzii (strain ATCC MYA-826 / Pb01) TaxID=502779 RepID=C1H6U9_PARBA|nr:serine/threonine-protein kinase ppk15 [Paracoccidioides lutzii Pb01]EEH35443.2 serine/threonine-protein kinase ppk15 [Paracoccidioides lutzii Pb01]